MATVMAVLREPGVVVVDRPWPFHSRATRMPLLMLVLVKMVLMLVLPLGRWPGSCTMMAMRAVDGIIARRGRGKKTLLVTVVEMREEDGKRQAGEEE